MSKSSPKRTRAKVFWSGRSQAVRLPKAFRVPGNEVLIRRDGDAIVLEPITAQPWPPGYWDSFGVGEDFEAPDALPPPRRIGIVSSISSDPLAMGAP